MEDIIAVRAVYYENGTRRKADLVFSNEAALEAFFDEQARVMGHAGFRAERGEGFVNFYPPSDSLSDGSFMTWTKVED